MQLLHLFVELVHRAGDVRPVKARTGGLRLNLLRAPQTRQTMGDLFHRLRGGALSLLAALELLPREGFAVAEDVWVARDHLSADRVGHVVKRERAAVGLEIGMKNDLQQDIAQLLAQRRRVLAVDGVHHLPRLLQHLAAQGRVRLRGVPRAAARRAQQMNDLPQILQIVVCFLFKMYHIYAPIARGFPVYAQFLHRRCSLSAIFSPFGRASRSSRRTAPSATASTP